MIFSKNKISLLELKIQDQQEEIHLQKKEMVKLSQNIANLLENQNRLDSDMIELKSKVYGAGNIGQAFIRRKNSI